MARLESDHSISSGEVGEWEEMIEQRSSREVGLSQPLVHSKPGLSGQRL